MITVCFYGDLRRFGRRFVLQAASPAEALHALFSQISGLREAVRGGAYQVRFNKADHSEQSVRETFAQPASGILHIVPRVQGAGKVGQIVLGVVLIVVGVFTSWAGGTFLIQAGIGLVIGGIAQMLVKQPKLDHGSGGVESSKNTSFSNLTNTAAQGRPVPLAYGLCYCGSRVVSQGVESRRINQGGSESGGSMIRMIAQAAGVQAVGSDPLAADMTLDMEKTFVQGTAATAPNGERYQTDFNDDSVRARNYTAAYRKA